MYTRVSQELNSFLKPLSISTSCTDIFEETLLKLAGVQAQPTRCQFSPYKSNWGGEADPVKMYFRIKGISSQDAEKFLNYFKLTHGDVSATMHYSEPLKPGYLCIPEDAEWLDAHTFEVDAETVFNKILPLFKSEITRLQNESPDALSGYKEKTRKYLDERSQFSSISAPSPALTPAPEPSMLGGLYNFFSRFMGTGLKDSSEDSENEQEQSNRFSP